MKRRKKRIKRICRDCKKRKASTKGRLCPFIMKVHGKRVNVVICESCFMERTIAKNLTSRLDSGNQR